MDLPVWQGLYEELRDKNFMVVAVAMDSRDAAARPWIEAAAPSYPALIDRDHHVADLYNMVNVPQAVWIDEDGIMVRPPETAGAYEGFRAIDRTSGQMPEDELAKTTGAKKTYLAALHDWVLNGPASAHAFDADQARAHLARASPEVCEAHAHFQLGQHLLRQGRDEEAEGCFARARELHPESWNIWRQTANVDERGLAAGPEFWARVDALGAKRYYAHVDMTGMP